MTILIDLDSTITNFGKVLLRTLNHQYKTNHSYDEITSWDWFDKTFENPWECTRYAKFWDEVEPNIGAVTCISDLVTSGHVVYIVTASHFSPALGYKIKRTLSWFSPIIINEDNIIITSQKSQIKGDVLIDDGLHNLYEFFDGIGIVYNQPWNRGNRQFRRVHDWFEVKDTISNMTTLRY